MPDEPVSVPSADNDSTRASSPADLRMIDEKRQALIRFAEHIEEEKKIEVTRLSDEDLIITILIKIPLIFSVLNRMKVIGTSTFDLATLNVDGKKIPTPSSILRLPWLTALFENLGLVASVVNFMTLPMVFMVSRLLNKPSPVSLTVFGEWLYAGFMLALMVVSIAVPVTAPIIGAVMVALGFLYSLYLFDKFSREKTKLEVQLSEIDNQIRGLEETVDAIKHVVQHIHSKMIDAAPDDLEQYEYLLSGYGAEIDAQYQTLTLLKTKKFQMNQELKAYDKPALLDTSVGLAVSFLILVGFGLSVLNPMIGFGLSTVAILLGATYALTRMLIAGGTFLVQSIRSHWKVEAQDQESPGTAPSPSLQSEIGLEAQQEKTPGPVSSPAQIVSQLGEVDIHPTPSSTPLSPPSTQSDNGSNPPEPIVTRLLDRSMEREEHSSSEQSKLGK